MINKFSDFNLHKICKEYDIENYTIRDGLVDVDGDVDLGYKNLRRLPLKFGVVSGDFLCNSNQLTTLEGAPEEVTGDFDCCYNQLVSLDGAPQQVGGYFDCYNNKLTSLQGAPKEVGGHFYCYKNNPLPEEILNFNFKDIKYILKWQDEYNIWRNGKLDLFRFKQMIDDYDK